MTITQANAGEVLVLNDRPLRVGELRVPPYPTFATVEEERLHRKQRLAAAFRVFGKFGYDEGVAGHITARDPELTDHFWVNPLGVAFSQIKVSDLELVSHDGSIVVGDRPINTAAFAIHSHVHQARTDVIAAAHSHAMYGKAWSSLGRLLDPITQDACIFYRTHSLYDDFNGIVLDDAEGTNVAQALGPNKAVILQNHGFLTVGGTVDEAAFLFITAERSAQAQLLAEAAGTPKLIRHEVAAPLGADRGYGRYGFKPYWDLITAEQPDLFD